MRDVVYRRMVCCLIFALILLGLYCTDTQAKPKPPITPPENGGGPIKVYLDIYILDIDEVNTANQSFTAGVYYEARWKDPRNSVSGKYQREVPLEDVWHPRLQILSQQRVWPTFPKSVEITEDGTVIYRQRVWGSFSQPLALHDFPFDKQKLKIVIVAAGYKTDQVVFADADDGKDRKSGIARKFSLPDWKVLKWNAGPVDISPIPGRQGIAAFGFVLELGRYSQYYIFKVIFPLAMIIAMSWIAFWIDPKEIAINISAANPRRIWSGAKWIEFIERLHNAEPEIRMIVLGAPGEGDICAALVERYDWVSTMPTRSFLDAVAIIARCRMLVSPDTGIVHAAIARGVPVAVLYNGDWEVFDRFYPLTVPYRAVIAARSADVESIAVEDVLEATRELLEKIREAGVRSN